ncbi:MAG: hypothetical protein WCL29_00985 [Pseudomonadota bacterium]
MKTNNMAKRFAGILGLIVITIVLVTGFTTATENQYVRTSNIAEQAAPEVITVTATRLTGNSTNIAKSTAACQAFSC